MCRGVNLECGDEAFARPCADPGDLVGGDIRRTQRAARQHDFKSAREGQAGERFPLFGGRVTVGDGDEIAAIGDGVGRVGLCAWRGGFGHRAQNEVHGEFWHRGGWRMFNRRKRAQIGDDGVGILLAHLAEGGVGHDGKKANVRRG